MRSASSLLYTRELEATLIVMHNNVLCKTVRKISGKHLDTVFQYKVCKRFPHLESRDLQVGDLVVKCPAREIVHKYSYWHATSLRRIALGHGLVVRRKEDNNVRGLRALISAHECRVGECAEMEYVFHQLKIVRPGSEKVVLAKFAEAVNANSTVNPEGSSRDQAFSATPSNIERRSARDPQNPEVNREVQEHLRGEPSTAQTPSLKHLIVPSEDLKRAIAKEWEETVSTEALRDIICAVCARGVPPSKIQVVDSHRVDLELLRNESLPEAARPTSYNMEAYDRAILDSAGLASPNEKADMNICRECARDLIDEGKMPKYALANWLYYGHDALPPDVRLAFKEATWTERVLVSRARASRISLRFSQKPGHYLWGSDGRLSQRYIKGNVAIHPQDAVHLNESLPPTKEVIKDMICAIFVSGDTKVNRKNIEDLKPVPMLARKSRAKTMIQFLIEQNAHYAEDGSWGGFNQRNLDNLFSIEAGDVDGAIPCAMEIGCLQSNSAIEAATEGYLHMDESEQEGDGSEITMDSVGYSFSDGTPLDTREMKIRALKHCLSGGEYMESRQGSRFIPDFDNHALLSWLFPHLDPWGIGGFSDPRHLRPLSMEEQLKYLLSVYDSSFRNDPDFSFVYYNILQKKAVFDSVTFQVPASQRERVVDRLLAIDPATLDTLSQKFRADPQYHPQDEGEKEIVRILARVNAISHNLPGTDGYKVGLRNRIRSLINHLGTPTLFVTLNPSDREHPLVRLYAGENISLEDATRGVELSDWERNRLVAQNPAACAKFFHTMITSFINVILKYGQDRKGLFGKCTGYFGTVEAQGRGTLHCHMLIWLEGHPSPQKLREKMAASDDYKRSMFSWLESIIKCELLETTEVVLEERGKPLEPPQRPAGSAHPGTLAPPSVDAFEDPEDYKAACIAYINELVSVYNWHKHKKTCFKYAAAEGSIPNDPEMQDKLCRMRIDGSTRAHTDIDEETGSILLRRLHPRIANYNDLVMLLLRGNMDIKYIGSGEAAKALVYYITDYITKSSLSMHVGLGALSYAIKKSSGMLDELSSDTNRLARTALTITVNRMMSRQEISHQQVMSYLVGGGDHYTSHTFKLLYWRSFDHLFRKHFNENRPVYEDTNRQRAQEAMPSESEQPRSIDATANELHPTVNDEVDSMNVDEGPSNIATEQHNASEEQEDTFILTLAPGSIGATNQQQDYVYRSIEPAFDDLCLYEFVGGVEKISKPRSRDARDGEGDPVATGRRTRRGRRLQARGEFSERHTQCQTHMLRLRSVFSVPVILGDRMPRPDRGEDEQNEWARTMLILFVPWRTPGDLRNIGESWWQAYERQRDRIKPCHQEVILNMNVLSECRDVRDSHRAMRRAQAAALLNEWLPQGSWEGGHGNNEEETEDEEEYEVIRAGQVYEDSVGIGTEHSDKLLDTTIGATARMAFDYCFDNNNGEIRSAESERNGQYRELREEDLCTLDTHASTMRHLKRVRRPQQIHDDNPRPRRRRRIDEVIEHIEPTEVMEEAPPPRNSRDPVYNRVDVGHTIEEIVEEMGLNNNPEQERAFRIVGEHVQQGGPEQLLMYIAGVGGTGKTHVVKSIRRLFDLLNRSKEILVGAPTGAAAKNIEGYTVHSLMMLRAKGKANLEKLQDLWAPVKYFIIDEVSMIGAKFLSEISYRLQQAKARHGDVALEPFGGVHVIFTGDFGQLRPVSAMSLYDHRLVSHPGLQQGQTIDGINSLKGAYLWRLVRTVVKLTKNQRQRDDPTYADLLSRVRVGQCQARPVDSHRQSDVDILFKRIAHRILQHDPTSLREFADAPVIVGSKALRDAINRKRAFQHASTINEPCHIYHSRDRS